jgi:hypothetical protein
MGGAQGEVLGARRKVIPCDVTGFGDWRLRQAAGRWCLRLVKSEKRSTLASPFD